MMNKRWVRLILTSLLVAVLGFGLSGSAFASGDSSQGKVPLEKARQVLEERLVGLPGIAGIAHSEEAGEIIVFLENERAKDQVPSRFEGFLVRTEITGKFYAHSVGVADPVAPSQANLVSDDRKGKVSTLIGGISVSALAGELYIYAGTLGMVTYDNKILSNAHVIAMNPDNNDFLAIGDPIVQPGTLDGGQTEDNKVGALFKYIPIEFGQQQGPFKFRGPTNYADAAIATIDPLIEFSPGEQYSESDNYWVSGTTTVDSNEYVKKSGRTSGITESKVDQTNATVIVDYGGGKVARFADQITIFQPFSQGGDSGSVVVDIDGKFVGLVFAGSTDRSVVCKASYIIEGLGISVEPTGPPPDPPSLTSIEVTPETASIVIEGTQQFTATGTYSDGSTADLTTEVTWTSSNEDFATIDAFGLATGIALGTVDITATSSEGPTDTATLEVTSAPIQPTVKVTIEMDTDYRTAGPRNVFVWAIATVSVGIDGATVEGHWEAPSYSTVSGTTDASGDVSLQSNEVKNPSVGTTFTFVVDRVTKGDIIYNFTADSELTDSIDWEGI